MTNARAFFLVALLLFPLAAAQGAGSVPRNVRVVEGNQRFEVHWDPPPVAGNLTGYVVRVEDVSGAVESNVTATSYLHFGVNGRTYQVTVAARFADGTRGNMSAPVSATPRLANDLQYLEAGLVLTWLGIFGYAVFLARRERHVDRKLEQLLSHRRPRSK